MRRIAFAVLLTGVGLTVGQVAQAKPFMDYVKPAPIVCSPLSSATWGVAGVLPRDLCNGIESAKGQAVPPEFYYWDGQILKAKDGKYHMFMSTWSGTAGFNPGWQGSDAYHAISSQGVLGPYMRQGFVYTNNNSHKGHNVSALELPDGSYAVVVSETVPFTIYRSTSLDGPWTGCVASIQTNGIKTVSTVACPPGGACGDAHHEANVSLVARHDGKFEIAQRHGFIAIADTLCGPYRMQKPTWTYPQANLPNVDSIYPKRTSIPGVSNPTYGWEEDPHIWYSGGVYHVIYSGSQDRVGYHLYSTDGLTNWKDNGYGWSPREYQKLFGYEGSTTYNQWYKMERPGVVLENGHPTHITWAVADVDKDNQIPGNSNHGSKIIVVPFDGVAFDADFGTGGAGGAGGAGGTGGAIAVPTIGSTNLVIVAHGLDLTISGSGVGSATAVTIGGVAHTFTVASNTQVRTRVLDTTPTGGQSIVVTNAGGSSLPFPITVIHLVINELDPDQASIDSGEFVEISAGVGSISLADYSLVFWNGANETAYDAVDLLGSTNGAGLLTVGNAAVVSSLTFPDNTLQNGADAVAIYAAPASSFPNGSLLTSTRLIDAVVYGSDDTDDAELLNGLFGPTGTAGRVQVNEAANAMPTTQSILRCGTARLRGDRFVLGTPTPSAANGVAACN